MRRLMMLAMALVFSASGAAAQDLTLPQPVNSGGPALYDSLKNRASATFSDFDKAGPALSDQTLSNLLWATSGQNRAEKGWVVPMAHGYPPYCDVYVLNDNGVFLYKWADNSLQQISAQNMKDQAGGQGFVKNASCIFAFVANLDALKGLNNDVTLAYTLTGAMTQNLYLACQAEGVGARYIMTMSPGLGRALGLNDQQKPIAIMALIKMP